MNREWAITRLKKFLDIAQLTYVPDAPNTFGFAHYRLTNKKEDVQGEAPIAEQVLDRVLPDWRTADWEQPSKQPLWRHREAANRAIALLETEQELLDNLGTGAPELDASTMHPWV